MSSGAKVAVVASLTTAVYDFCQYALRSAPAVMMPELSDAFRTDDAGRRVDGRSLLLYGVSLAIVLTVFLKETGPGVQPPLVAIPSTT